MKVNFEFSFSDQLTTITATRTSFDAPPPPPVQFHASLLSPDPDRLHIAAALLFHNEIAGELVLDEAVECSPHVAVQISRFFSPVAVTVRHQTFLPRAIPSGRFTMPLYIEVNGSGQQVRFAPMKGDVMLRFIPEGIGSMFSESEVTIGTNLCHCRGSMLSSLNDTIRLIGGAVLFAEELQVSAIRLPEELSTAWCLERLARVDALLSTTGLSLEFSDSDS